MVVTYSSGSGDNIHTTDVGKDKCTDRHGGTSAAAPLGAGIFALALQVRPELTWRDMQHLAVNTAVQILPDDQDWQTTATGRLYNHKFGFGKLDAWAIVEAARTWNLVKPQAWYMSPNVAADAAITEDGVVGAVEITREELDNANFERLEHITIAVNIVHQRRGNVEVMLTSPHGTHSVLARPRRFDESSTGYPGWVFMSVKHWGEDPVGKWTLTVKDTQKNGKNGTFQNFALGLWGECKDASKQELFKMPDDAQIHLPPSPVATESEKPSETATSSLESEVTARPTKAQPTNPPPAVSDSDIQTEKTKSIVRPTAHLPGDHADDTAVASSTAPAASFVSTATASNPAASGSLEDDLSGLGGMSGLLQRTSSWVFVATGSIIVICGGIAAFFLLRRHQRQKRGGMQGSRPGGYDFEPVAQHGGEEEVAMGALEGRGRVTGGEGRTRDLYDAFGVGSDSEGEDEAREKIGLRKQSLTDHYMDSFLADDATPLANRAQDDESTTSLPRREPHRNGRSDESEGEELFDVGKEI